MQFIHLRTLLCLFFMVCFNCAAQAEEGATRKRSEPASIQSSWDDLLEGVNSPEEWVEHKKVLRRRYLELIRDQFKPKKPAMEIQFHDTVIVDGLYRRQLISYQVEDDERAHAYLGVPLNLQGPAPSHCCLAWDLRLWKETGGRSH